MPRQAHNSRLIESHPHVNLFSELLLHLGAKFCKQWQIRLFQETSKVLEPFWMHKMMQCCNCVNSRILETLENGMIPA